MENETVKNLIESGLEPREAKIYMAVLHLGKSSIAEIARKSGVKRMTVYQYIDELVRKNLLHKTVEGKRIFYIAESPEKISKMLDRKKKHFEKVLPELKTIYGTSSHKPQIRFYEGIEGMRTIYREMTMESKPLYGIFSAEKYFTVFSSKDNEEFFKNVRDNGGQIKDMIENSEIGKKHAKSQYYKNIGSPKILPKDFNVAVDLMISGNKTAMISLVNLVGVIIENDEIAEVQRNMIKFMRRALK
jgi:HTH-type transcriptional regulator, sugar sensing transcriptional regulator